MNLIVLCISITMDSALNELILRKIELKCLDIMSDINCCTAPKFFIPRRSNWGELSFDETVKLKPALDCRAYSVVDTNRLKSLKKFAVMLKLVGTIYTLIQEGKFCTKRDIFYRYPGLYSTQGIMDRIIDDIACMLEVPRWDLHILATSKGLVAGDLLFSDSQGQDIDCQFTAVGIPIPTHMKDMQNIITTARFVLVVEKDAVFQKLLSDNFCGKMKPCILMTGKGFPDNGTRLLLRKLWMLNNIPIFILVDADPHGIEIMFVYKYGSMNQAFENERLAVPQAEWIGIWPEDIKRLSIKGSSLAQMTNNDTRKAQSLKKRPYVTNDETLLSQVDILIETGLKAEIQSLDSISTSYLCDVYLPSKINLMYPSSEKFHTASNSYDH